MKFYLVAGEGRGVGWGKAEQFPKGDLLFEPRKMFYNFSF